jgi:hypothetical protein
MSFFYANSRMSLFDGTQIEAVKGIPSLMALVLLVLQFKNDTEGTLLTTCPLAHLIFCRSTAFCDNEGDLAQRGTFATLAVACVCTFLQTVYWCRAMVVPVYAGLGAAGNFAGASTAQDIILCVAGSRSLDLWVALSLSAVCRLARC